MLKNERAHLNFEVKNLENIFSVIQKIIASIYLSYDIILTFRHIKFHNDTIKKLSLGEFGMGDRECMINQKRCLDLTQ